MAALQELLHKSIIIAIIVTIAVVVAVVYQYISVREVDRNLIEVLVGVITYWIGVLTPTPAKLNGE